METERENEKKRIKCSEDDNEPRTQNRNDLGLLDICCVHTHTVCDYVGGKDKLLADLKIQEVVIMDLTRFKSPNNQSHINSI